MKELSSIRLNYKKIELSDFLDFYSLYSDPRVMRYTYLDVCGEASAREIFREVFEEKVFTYYSVKKKEDGSFIGFVFYNTTLEHPKGGIISIGYMLHPDAWKKGYATEMAKTLMDFLFANRSIHKVEANGHAENIASEKILLKIGMKKEGTARNARYKNNTWGDEFHYGILREEWEKSQ